jgi:arylsulfatase A-like enzyme
MHRLLALALLLLTAAPSQAEDKPNIILFLVDDMGWQDTSVAFGEDVTPFNRRYRTPAMENLAARSMLFTNAYSASPVCTPTRTSIMTGLSPGRTHITYWTLYPNKDTSKDRPRIAAPPWRMEGLQEHDQTLPKRLREAGYHTIHAGKAHFGAVGTPGANPTNLGFDLNIAGHGPGGPGSYYGTHDFQAQKRQGKTGKSIWDVPGLERYHGKDIFLTEAITLEVLKAIDHAAESDKPFFLNFAPYAIHAPIMANKKYLANYEGLDPREAAYATLIESMDAALGATVERLKKLGIIDNTIIIFASDNGGLSAHARGGVRHTHNAPLRSGKGSAYEGGVRVPFMVAWPGVTDEPSRTDTPTIAMDIHATILEMAGVEVPSTTDGESLVEVLTGDGELDRGLPLVWHMPHQWGAKGPGIEPFTSIRIGSFKCYFFHDGPRVELYDLGNDLSETNDLAQAQPEVVRQCLLEMDAWFDATDAQSSISKPSGEPVIRPRAHALTGGDS